MIETILAILGVISLCIALPVCLADGDKYRSDRNVFRDKWIVESEIDGLKDEIAKLKAKDNEEEETDA